MRSRSELLTGEGSIELRRPVAAITRNFAAIAALSVSFAVMAYVFSSSMTPSYTATAMISSQAVGQEENVDVDTAQRQLAAATALATSTAVLDSTAARTGATPADVRTAVFARLDPGTGVIGISATALVPRRAAALANAAATEFLTQRAAGIREGLEATESSLRAEMDRLGEQGEPAAEDVRVLHERVADIRVRATLAGRDLGLVRAAAQPSEPSSPKPLLSAFLALMASAIVASVVVVARDTLRKPVTSTRELEALVRAPVIALMRDGRRAKRAGGVMAEDTAMRLAFESWAAPGRKLIVVSAPARGDSTAVVERLGRSFAQAGHNTLVIDADLDRPALDERFLLPREPGLTRILARMGRGTVSGAALRRAARQVPGSAELAGRLAVLASGGASEDGDRILTVKTLTALVEAARDTNADYILVRVPPIADTPHALVLARRADALVLALDRRTMRADAAADLGTLARSLGPEVGLVVLDRPAGTIRREPPRAPAVPEPRRDTPPVTEERPARHAAKNGRPLPRAGATG
jgi:capsular polysaccharide biosynthesis protein